MFKIKKIAGIVTAVTAVSIASISSAFADIDISEITQAKADVLTVGAAIIAIFVAIAGFRYIRKVF